MRGASALQKVLGEHAGLPLRVFVVWEPVITTDIAPPTTAKLGLIHDLRAIQYWDHDRALSQDMMRAVLANPSRYHLGEDLDEDAIVWDAVALFPKGVIWEQDVPVPSYYGSPVVEAVSSLPEALIKTASSAE